MKCINKTTKQEYAVKILRLHQSFDNEIDALTEFRGHPNIVNIVEVIKDTAFTYIVTELLAGMELFEYVEKQPLGEYEARGIFKDILDAVSHMHNNNVAHRDLKLENIKFTGENVQQSKAKILDFGFACKTNDGEKMTGTYYTLDYAAPEILCDMEYDESCDLWSLGVILYTILCGSLPFRRWTNSMEDDLHLNSDHNVIKRIKTGRIDYKHERFECLSDSVKDLIQRLLTIDPEQRIQLHEVFAHDWIQRKTKQRILLGSVEEKSEIYTQITKKRTVCNHDDLDIEPLTKRIKISDN